MRKKGTCFPRSAFCFLPSADCLLLCRLPTAFGGSSSCRDSCRVAQSTTRCHRQQGKKKLVTLKIEGTARECL